MQIRLYRDGTDMVVSIPTADGEKKGVIPYRAVADSSRSEPASIFMTDPHPMTSYSRPIGERPVVEQDRLAAEHRANADRLYAEENPDTRTPPNSGPESKTQQDSIRGPFATAQVGMTARELRGEDPKEEGLPTDQVEINPSRPAASLPDSDERERLNRGLRVEPGVHTGGSREAPVTQPTGRGATETGGPTPSLGDGERAQAERTLRENRAVSGSAGVSSPRAAPAPSPAPSQASAQPSAGSTQPGSVTGAPVDMAAVEADKAKREGQGAGA